jgi:hypothetical protein
VPPCSNSGDLAINKYLCGVTLESDTFCFRVLEFRFSGCKVFQWPHDTKRDRLGLAPQGACTGLTQFRSCTPPRWCWWHWHWWWPQALHYRKVVLFLRSPSSDRQCSECVCATLQQSGWVATADLREPGSQRRLVLTLVAAGSMAVDALPHLIRDPHPMWGLFASLRGSSHQHCPTGLDKCEHHRLGNSLQSPASPFLRAYLPPSQVTHSPADTLFLASCCMDNKRDHEPPSRSLVHSLT